MTDTSRPDQAEEALAERFDDIVPSHGYRQVPIVALGGSAGSNSQADDIALRRYGTPQDCAKVIEFLTTDLSDYVTGALIPIDGGWNRSD